MRRKRKTRRTAKAGGCAGPRVGRDAEGGVEESQEEEAEAGVVVSRLGAGVGASGVSP